VALTGQTAGVSNFFGGFLPQWNETGTLKPETEPEFRQIELVAHELSAYTEIKDAMIQDSPIAIAQFLRENGRDALMFYSDEAFLDGTGAGMPQGIITAPGTLTIARDTAGTIVYEDVKTMFMHAVASGRARSVWICNQMIMTQLMDMVDPAGNLIWQPSARDGLPGRMLGLPVLWTEKTPTLGTAGDIILADFQHYIIGRKEDVSIGMSEHYRFRYNRTAFRFVLRVDGQEDLAAPIYLKSGVDQVSPFVILGGAATT
jgi:HK97 family phage major capsid protein